jgi:hypothetical protein
LFLAWECQNSTLLVPKPGVALVPSTFFTQQRVTLGCHLNVIHTCLQPKRPIFESIPRILYAFPVPHLVSYIDYFTLLCQVRSHFPNKRPSYSRPTEVTTEISVRKSQTAVKILLTFHCEVHFELYVLSAAYHECGSLSPRHGASSGCGWRNGFLYGG